MTPPVPTSADRRWAKEAGQIEFTQLSGVRAQAEGWRNGLVAVTALVGVVLTVASPLVGSEGRSDEVRIAVVVAALLALASLIMGSWLAMLASFGTSSPITNTGQALKSWTRSNTKNAVCQLRWARIATLVGTVLLGVAAAIGLIGGVHPGFATLVQLNDGQLSCGTVTSSVDGTVLSLRAPDGTIQQINLSDIKRLKLDSGC